MQAKLNALVRLEWGLGDWKGRSTCIFKEGDVYWNFQFKLRKDLVKVCSKSSMVSPWRELTQINLLWNVDSLLPAQSQCALIQSKFRTAGQGEVYSLLVAGDPHFNTYHSPLADPFKWRTGPQVDREGAQLTNLIASSKV